MCIHMLLIVPVLISIMPHVYTYASDCACVNVNHASCVYIIIYITLQGNTAYLQAKTCRDAELQIYLRSKDDKYCLSNT